MTSQTQQRWPAGRPPLETEVLVVGGGPVGSALALDLALRGVDVVVAERSTEIPLEGRARSVSARSMEHFRRWGVTANLAEASTIPQEWYGGISYRASLAGPELLKASERADPSQWRSLSPERPFRLPQYLTNTILRDHGMEHGAVVASGWTLDSLDANSDRIEAALSSGSDRVTTVAHYVVGCDGSSSTVRTAIGVGLDRSPLKGKQFSVIVRLPDLFDQIGVPPNAFNWILNEYVSDAFNPFDAEHFSMSIGEYDVDHELTDEEVVEETRRRVGVDVDPEITSVASWLVQKRIAQSFRNGRVFLAGDAAHTFPPTLGQNMNTGISDAANLGWKLAAVLREWGHPDLLESYDTERRPIAHRIADTALWAKDANNKVIEYLQAHPPRRDISPESKEANHELAENVLTQLPYMKSAGVSMDQRYEESPIVVADASRVPEWRHDSYQPVAAPGHRAPHLYSDEGVPLYDACGLWFGLVYRPEARKDAERMSEAARSRGMTLSLVDLGSNDHFELYPHRLALIRPDGYLSWHGDETPDQIDSLLDHVLGVPS